MRTRDLVRRHERLFGQMAETVGVDLLAAWDHGKVSLPEMDRAVARCMTCPDPDGCALWLDQRRAGAGHAPPICRNRNLLERLRG